LSLLEYITQLTSSFMYAVFRCEENILKLQESISITHSHYCNCGVW
jgi:hypothetical protein